MADFMAQPSGNLHNIFVKLCLSTLDEFCKISGFEGEFDSACEKTIQSCVKTFLLSSENHPQDAPLPTAKIHKVATFLPATPGTRQECFTRLCRPLQDIWEMN